MAQWVRVLARRNATLGGCTRIRNFHSSVVCQAPKKLFNQSLSMSRFGGVCIARAFSLAGLRLLPRRNIHCSTFRASSNFNQPLSGNEMPRFGGVATMMRLPHQDGNPEGLDACFVGIPMDVGSPSRSGHRHGPRDIRRESTMLRPCNITGAMPFESLNVADIGDVPVDFQNIHKSMEIITKYYDKILKADCIPLTLGGDHSLSLPILRAMKEKYGPIGLIQIDAHPDFHDKIFGEKFANGTSFRRALEEGLVSPKHMVQIGLRGSVLLEEFEKGFEWGRDQGVRMVFADECWHKSLSPLMESVRDQMGDLPVYLTIDMDGVDPGVCPGIGNPEVGGLTAIQALEIVRGCKGLNIIGGDVAEVDTLFDPATTTANMAATLLFEMLCVLPGVKYTSFRD